MINNKKPKAALDNDEEVEMMAQMMAMFPNIEGIENECNSPASALTF